MGHRVIFSGASLNYGSGSEYGQDRDSRGDFDRRYHCLFGFVLGKEGLTFSCVNGFGMGFVFEEKHL